MAVNIREFQNRRTTNIRLIDRALKLTAGTAKRKLASEVFDQLVKGTPRDTGRAANSWNMNSSFPDFDPKPPGNYPGTPTAESQPASFEKPDGKIFIANGVPYILPLEFGHSQGQQPTGWVRETVENFAIRTAALAEAARMGRSLGLRVGSRQLGFSPVRQG